MQHYKRDFVLYMMLRFAILIFFSLFFSSLRSQVKANDSLYTIFNHHNTVDSLYLYQSFKWKNNEFELTGVEKLDKFLFEISSKGGLINITTRYSSEDFIYKGDQEEYLVIKLDTNREVYHKKMNLYLYEESSSEVLTYFYYFADQPGRIYRFIKDKKRMNILIYFISPKD